LPHIPAGASGKAPAALKVSLGTADPASSHFLARYAAAAARFDATVAKALKVASGAYDALDAPTIAYLGNVFERDWLAHDEKHRWESGPEGAARVRGGWHWKLPEFKEWRGDGDLDAIEEEWGGAARQLLTRTGKAIDPTDAQSFRMLCRELNDAAIRVSAVSLARLAGAVIPTPAAAPPVVMPLRCPLRATFDAYAIAAELSPIVAQDWGRCIDRLALFLGHQDAAKITVKDLMLWRDDLLSEGVRQPVTVRGKYIGSVKAMMAWAVKEHLLDINVAQSVSVSVKKRIRLRDPGFTDDEAQRILSATFLPLPANLSKEHGRARRWVPWLCAYTGARVNEMTQLRREDVHLIGEVWSVRITPEAGTVKNRAARTVPLHPHLVEQGFPQLIEALPPGPIFYAPSRQRVQSADNRHVKKVGERLAAWVRKEAGVSDPEVQPNHAWRHRFKTEARRVHVDTETRDAIQGHAPGTQGQDYGTVPLSTMAAAISLMPRYEVPGA
jgi:integrase